MKAGSFCAGTGNGMNRRIQYGRVDWFRLAAALMVIAIHTAPFSMMEGYRLDAVLTYGLCRVAVPFFLMTSGYFVLASCVKSGGKDRRYVQFLKKTLILYGGAVLLYAPVMWYAKKLPANPGELLKMLVFDGTFYHLWYFPALILGCMMAVWMLKGCGLYWALTIAGVLYFAGLLGDSYYGLIPDGSFLKNIYEGLFQVSSYTRNGIFYAPLFLLMGAALGEKKNRCPRAVGYLGFILSLILMLLESYATDVCNLQRHSSMYLALPAVMYFLYQILLEGERTAPGFLRKGTAFLYVIHPIGIILVRGAADILGIELLLVENSLIHYGAACVVSLVMMVYYLYFLKVIQYLKRKCK